MKQFQLTMKDLCMTNLKHPGIKLIRKNTIFYVLTCCIIFILKYHYSQASCNNLAWMLSPTATLVEFVTGIDFLYEPQTGFISHQCHIIIAPACAGVNFMITALGLTAFSGFSHMIGKHKFLWLIASVLWAYSVTLCVNTLRIMISIFTYQSTLFGGYLTWERIHRLEGIFIYCIALYGVHAIVRMGVRYYGHALNSKKIISTPSAFFSESTAIWIGITPLIWYIGLTIIIPVLNGAYKKNTSMFIEHCLMVFLISGMCWGGTVLFHKLRNRE
ncbi:MAG: exosortase K [Proteobacteria bacterium]|nr:exosortase K [Pseudomonadota bacterium]